MEYVLASASPRRRELLARVVPDFSVQPSDFVERVDKSWTPPEVVCRLAEGKCLDVFLKNPDKVVIGCDTIVVFGGKILGKPKDEDDARETLKALSGKSHEVITGVCVRCGDKKLTDYETTKVRFNDLSGEFIESYVKSGSPMDKAGSYGIQDEGVVKDYRGSYTNVVGLPVELVKKMIEDIQRK